MKYLALKITILLFITTISLRAQEKASYYNAGNPISFTISEKQVFVETFPNQRLSKVSGLNFETLSDKNAILQLTANKGGFEQNKKELLKKYPALFKRIEPVLIYQDGVRQIVNGEISIKLKGNVTINELIGDSEFEAEESLFERGLFLVKTGLGTNELFELVNQLQANNRVVFAEPNFIRMIKPQSNDPFFNSQWSIKNLGYLGGAIDADMDVEEAWNYCATGSGVTVAIIDTGVDLNHPDLQSNLVAGYDATGGNNNGDVTGEPHGTACAGIVAASTGNSIGVAGVAFNAKIMPIKIFLNQTTNDTWIINGINAAIQNGADVLSNSYGGGSYSSNIANAVNNAVGAGAVVLFATGNENSGVFFPATLDNVIAVGASTMCDERKTPTSCDGESWWGSNYGSQLDVVAPGVKIYTTDISGSAGYLNGDYKPDFNGTSSACPNAAGVVALILSANPNLTGAEAREILESTVEKVGGYSYSTTRANGTWNNEMGYGRINARLAVTEAIRRNLSISGPGYICDSGVYSVANLPSGASVTWSLSPSGVPRPTVQNNFPATNLCLVSNQYSYPQQMTLTATVDFGCGETILVNRTIFSDSNAPVSGSINQPSCYAYNQYYPSYTTTINGSGPYFLNEGCMTTVTLNNMQGKTMELVTSTQPLFWSYQSNTNGTGTLLVQMAQYSGGIPFRFATAENGVCDDRDILFFSTRASNRYTFAATPNPLNDELSVHAHANDGIVEVMGEEEAIANLKYDLKIIDALTGQVRKEKQVKGKKLDKVNVRFLQPGTYILQITEADDGQTFTILKQ